MRSLSGQYRLFCGDIVEKNFQLIYESESFSLFDFFRACSSKDRASGFNMEPYSRNELDRWMVLYAGKPLEPQGTPHVQKNVE